MSLETYVARRYLFGQKKSWMVRLLAWVAVGGVAVSVFAILVIQSVMAGFGAEIKEKLIRFSPAIILTPVQAELFSGKQRPAFSSSISPHSLSPFLETEGILRTPDDEAQGAKIKAVDASATSFFEKLKPVFTKNFSLQDLKSSSDNLPGVLLGADFARTLGIDPDLNPEVELIYPFGEVDPSGEMHPKTRRFRVIGTFKTGYYDYDSRFCVIDLSEARRLVPATEVPTLWGIELSDLFSASQVAIHLNQELTGQYQATTWSEKNRKLFRALQLERVGMLLVLTVMGVIATFNAFSLIFMLVADKQKEIAIFKALGMGPKQIRRIFIRVGLHLGVVGTVLGTFLGLLTLFLMDRISIPLPSAYYLTRLPVRFEPGFILSVFLATPALTYLASIYPASRGEKFGIAEALRYE